MVISETKSQVILKRAFADMCLIVAIMLVLQCELWRIPLALFPGMLYRLWQLKRISEQP